MRHKPVQSESVPTLVLDKIAVLARFQPPSTRKRPPFKHALFNLMTPRPPTVADKTDSLIALGKAIEALNLHQLAAPVDNRDRRGAARGRRDNDAPFEFSCFWCGGKGHTLFECPEPLPNAKAKAARDMVAAAKADKDARNERTQARRLVPPERAYFCFPRRKIPAVSMRSDSAYQNVMK